MNTSTAYTPLQSKRGAPAELIAVLYHFQMMNPIWPDAQPWDNLLFVAAAVIVVLINRRTMFQPGGGVTDVLLTEEARR